MNDSMCKYFIYLKNRTDKFLKISLEFAPFKTRYTLIDLITTCLLVWHGMVWCALKKTAIHAGLKYTIAKFIKN